MSRKLVAAVAALEEKHREQIRAAAERNGFEALFFDHHVHAFPYLEDAEIVFGQSAQLAKRAPKLRWLCTPSAGVDQFRGNVFASPDAVLTNSSGAYGVTISEHVIMLLLEVLRRRPEYRAHMDRREWVRRLPVRGIFGSRITLRGTGDIGQETLRRLRPFAPEQILGVKRRGVNPGGLFDRIVQRDHLDDILPETEILIISLPGTRDTFRIISGKQLKLLPDDAVIINVGRGSVIDQRALEAELRSGRLYAALDVFEEEPVPPDASLWDCPRLIMTPHVAGDTTLPHTVDRIVELFLGDFENYCANRPLTQLVNRKIGY